MADDGWMDLCPQGGLEPDEARRIYAIIKAAVKQTRVHADWVRDGTKENELLLALARRNTRRAVEAYEKAQR